MREVNAYAHHKGRKTQTLWFSIHRTSDKTLDCLDKSADESYITVPGAAVLKYTRWDVY